MLELLKDEHIPFWLKILIVVAVGELFRRLFWRDLKRDNPKMYQEIKDKCPEMVGLESQERARFRNENNNEIKITIHGDKWQCPSCGEPNFSSQDACRECGQAVSFMS